MPPAQRFGQTPLVGRSRIVDIFLATRPVHLPLGVDVHSPRVPSLVWQTLYLQGFAQSEVFGAFSLTDVAGAHIEF